MIYLVCLTMLPLYLGAIGTPQEGPHRKRGDRGYWYQNTSIEKREEGVRLRACPGHKQKILRRLRQAQNDCVGRDLKGGKLRPGEQPVSDGETDRLHAALDAQFIHQVLDVVTGGVRRDAKILRDRYGGLSLGKMKQDFTLPRR